MIGTPSDFTQNFRGGAGWQRVVGPDGFVRLKPSWDAGALLIDQTELDGTSPVRLRHRLSDVGLSIEMTAEDGTRAGWRFRRQ